MLVFYKTIQFENIHFWENKVLKIVLLLPYLNLHNLCSTFGFTLDMKMLWWICNGVKNFTPQWWFESKALCYLYMLIFANFSLIEHRTLRTNTYWFCCMYSLRFHHKTSFCWCHNHARSIYKFLNPALSSNSSSLLLYIAFLILLLSVSWAAHVMSKYIINFW